MGKYFSIEELTYSETGKKLGIDNTPAKPETVNLNSLIDNLLDPIREAWGRPLFVNSGYRSALLNRSVGGASGSQHLLGMAADITAGDRQANRLLFEMIAGGDFRFDQLIDEKNYSWIHISYSCDKNRRQILHL